MNRVSPVPSFTVPVSPSPSFLSSLCDQAAIEKSARAAGMPSAIAEKYAQQLLSSTPVLSQPSESVQALPTDDFQIGDRVVVSGTK